MFIEQREGLREPTKDWGEQGVFASWVGQGKERKLGRATARHPSLPCSPLQSASGVSCWPIPTGNGKQEPPSRSPHRAASQGTERRWERVWRDNWRAASTASR